MKTSRPAAIYLRFLQLTEALRGLLALPSLNPLEERGPSLLARGSQQNERLCVRDVMAKDKLGSLATIHSRITSMRKNGWILLADTSGVRRKQLERLSRCLLEATKGGWTAGRKK